MWLFLTQPAIASGCNSSWEKRDGHVCVLPNGNHCLWLSRCSNAVQLFQGMRFMWWLWPSPFRLQKLLLHLKCQPNTTAKQELPKLLQVLWEMYMSVHVEERGLCHHLPMEEKATHPPGLILHLAGQWAPSAARGSGHGCCSFSGATGSRGAEVPAGERLCDVCCV